MPRRVMGNWATRHGRLLRRVARRHPLIARPPAGTMLPEAFGLRPYRTGRRFHLGRLLPPELEPPAESGVEPTAAEPLAQERENAPAIEAAVPVEAAAAPTVTEPAFRETAEPAASGDLAPGGPVEAAAAVRAAAPSRTSAAAGPPAGDRPLAPAPARASLPARIEAVVRRGIERVRVAFTGSPPAPMQAATPAPTPAPPADTAPTAAAGAAGREVASPIESGRERSPTTGIAPAPLRAPLPTRFAAAEPAPAEARGPEVEPRLVAPIVPAPAVSPDRPDGTFDRPRGVAVSHRPAAAAAAPVEATAPAEAAAPAEVTASTPSGAPVTPAAPVAPVETRGSEAPVLPEQPLQAVPPGEVDRPAVAPDSAAPVAASLAGAPLAPPASAAVPTAPPAVGGMRVAEERQARRPPPGPRPPARERGPRLPPLGEAAATVSESEPLPDPGTLFQLSLEGRSPQNWLERLRAAAAAEPATQTRTPAKAVPPVPSAGPGPAAPPLRGRLVAPSGPETSPQGTTGRVAPPAAGRTRVDTPAVAKPAPPAESPAGGETVSPAARRFLRPLVGIDPGEVEVRRGPEAEAVAERHQADAVTRGETIEIGSPAPEQSAEGLGLLAHELTHVARAREPRFVPPVLRGPEPARAAAEGPPPGSRRSAAPPVPGRATSPPAASRPAAPVREPEEAIAEEVEAAVRHLARPQEEGGAELPETPRPAAGQWSDLPAPWEPLPDLGFETAGDQAASEDTGAEPVGAMTASPERGASPVADLAASAAAPASAGVQRAARGREVEEEGSPGGAAEGEKAGGPDVEALARQVYGILKRRLAAERRRGG